jgi:hypothetical protein
VNNAPEQLKKVQPRQKEEQVPEGSGQAAGLMDPLTIPEIPILEGEQNGQPLPGFQKTQAAISNEKKTRVLARMHRQVINPM